MGGKAERNEFRLRRRRWLYAGLGLPVGVAVARRPAGDRAVPASVLLLGDDVAQAVAPPLVRLCRDAGVVIYVAARPSMTPKAWAEQGWLHRACVELKPQLLVLAFLASVDPADVANLAGEAGAVPTVWLSPHEPADVAEAGIANVVHLPSSPEAALPTAFAYAGWAGMLWERLQQPPGASEGQVSDG